MQKIQHKEWAEFWNSQFTLPYFIELDKKLTEDSKVAITLISLN